MDLIILFPTVCGECVCVCMWPWCVGGYYFLPPTPSPPYPLDKSVIVTELFLCHYCDIFDFREIFPRAFLWVHMYLILFFSPSTIMSSVLYFGSCAVGHFLFDPHPSPLPNLPPAAGFRRLTVAVRGCVYFCSSGSVLVPEDEKCGQGISWLAFSLR